MFGRTARTEMEEVILHKSITHLSYMSSNVQDGFQESQLFNSYKQCTCRTFILMTHRFINTNSYLVDLVKLLLRVKDINVNEV